MHVVRPLLAALLAASLAAPFPASAGTRSPGHADPAPVDPATNPGDCTDLTIDVTCGMPFFNEIGWLLNNAIATGHDDGTFHPTAPVTRQAMAAFLYRFEGEPPGPFPDPGFTDVDPTHPFYEAISWMAHAGIARGFRDGTFGTTAPVTRQAMAAFLYRFEGEPPGPFPDPGFTDVDPTHPFYEAISWMAHAGVTDGLADGSFGRTEPVLRRAMAAFLFRIGPYADIDVATAHRCELLDSSECLLPFPSNFLTTLDADTVGAIGHSDTGLRLNFLPLSLPHNVDGTSMWSDVLNSNDGFSPGQLIVTRIPGIDLVQTDAPLITDPARSLEEDSPIVVVDLETGERVPVFAELDANAGDPDRQALLIRPLRNYSEGHRHAVVLRNLRDGSGSTIEPTTAFRVYRDEIDTGIPVVEMRREAMEDIFTALAEGPAEIARDDLYLAWDFTTASERNLSERVLHMRDEAFAELGDDAPTFSVSSVEHPDGDPNIATRVKGTLEVPRYLDGTGATGSFMNYGADGMPEQNGMQTANFDCIIPHAASATDPAQTSLFGHGLLGTASQVTGFAEVAEAHNTVFCGTDLIGMASEDVPTAIAALGDLSLFATIPDRAQQGFLNFLYLGRLLEHDEGFASDVAFQDGGDPLIGDEGLVYVGGSQGGIMGGALTAIAQDWTRSVLAVPGMNYSTMLRRSSNWPTFEAFMNLGYTDELDHTLAISLIQLLWDRGEGNGYAHHITGDPYPGTPDHEVLLFEAFGDFQVANVATETMARTLGVHVRQPALGAGRSPIANQFWGIPAIPAYPFVGSVLLVWDWGTPAPPLTNTPPTDGDDPHGNVGDDDEALAQSMLVEFLDAGGLLGDACGGVPCTSPP